MARTPDLKGPCSNCGSNDNHWSKCTKCVPCPECKIVWCQGTRGKVCWGVTQDLPSYKDAQGAALNEKLAKHMDFMRKSKGLRVNADEPAREASAFEIGGGESDSDGGFGLMMLHAADD